MRSRRLLIILVVFIILAGIAIIGGTVFRIKKIEIIFTNTPSALNQDTVNNLLQNRLEKDLKGKNILFSLDKAKIEKDVEDAEIRLKVKNIKAEFPNRIVIDVQERFPAFVYKVATDTFIMDDEMRILYKTSIPDNVDVSTLTDISFVGSLFSTTSMKAGDYLFDDTAADREKIELIRQIPEFFEGSGSYTAAMIHQIRGVKFNPPVDGLVTMRVEVQPENRPQDVRLIILKAPGDDFIKLFEMAWASMVSAMPFKYENGDDGFKQGSAAGIYVISYNESKKLEVIWYSCLPEADTDDDGLPDRIEPDAKFTEGDE